MNCSVCKDKALFLCMCSTPYIQLCSKDLKKHLLKRSSHRLIDIHYFHDKVFHLILSTFYAIRNYITCKVLQRSQCYNAQLKRILRKNHNVDNYHSKSDNLNVIREVSALNKSLQIYIQNILSEINKLIKKIFETRHQLSKVFIEDICIRLLVIVPADSFIQAKLNALRAHNSEKPMMIFAMPGGEIYKGLDSITKIGDFKNSSIDCEEKYKYLQENDYYFNQEDWKISLNNTSMVHNPYSTYLIHLSDGEKLECRIVYKYLDGGIYYGDFKDGKKEGKGIYKSPNGEMHMGGWKNNLPEGRGVYITSDKSSYTGIFHHGKLEGYGFHRSTDGAVYIGYFKYGKKDTTTSNHSLEPPEESKTNFEETKATDSDFNSPNYDNSQNLRGIEIPPSTVSSEKPSVNDCRQELSYASQRHEPRGMYRHPSGISYWGQWKSDLKCGRGVYNSSDGSVYSGEWLNNLKSGKGIQKYPKGSVYEGYFALGKKHGQGVYKHLTGEVYDGNWKNGLKEGRGIYRYVNGSVYEGDWKANKAEGRGVYKYPDEALYEGTWRNGLQEGLGVYTHPDGDRYEGYFAEANYEGRGVYTYADGTAYDGYYHKGKRSGKGIFTYPNGDIYDGGWENNLKEGEGCYRHSDGRVENGIWRNDVFLEEFRN